MKAEEAPQSFADLLDPKWKGKMVSQDFLFPRLMGFLALEWGEERTEPSWGGGALFDLGVHAIALALLMAAPARVTAVESATRT